MILVNCQGDLRWSNEKILVYDKHASRRLYRIVWPNNERMVREEKQDCRTQKIEGSKSK
jgi:hypothetical protein